MCVCVCACVCMCVCVCVCVCACTHAHTHTGKASTDAAHRAGIGKGGVLGGAVWPNSMRVRTLRALRPGTLRERASEHVCAEIKI